MERVQKRSVVQSQRENYDELLHCCLAIPEQQISVVVFRGVLINFSCLFVLASKVVH